MCYNFRMNEFHTDWLFRQLPVLVEKDVLTEESAEKIKSYYENQKEIAQAEAKSRAEELKAAQKIRVSKRIPVILSVLSAILIAGGIISLIAYNWAAISRLSKTFAAIFMLVVSQSSAVYLGFFKKNVSSRTKEAFSLFWALLFGALVAFISQIYRFPSDSAGFLLVWSLSSILITYIFKSSATFILSLIQIFAYMTVAWNGNLTFFYLLLALIAPFALQKESTNWQKYTIFCFSAVLFAPMIFRLPSEPCRILFCSSYSALFSAFIIRKKKNFRFVASLCLFMLALIFVSMISDSDFSPIISFSENGNLFEHILTYFVAGILILVSLGIPLWRNFFKKEKIGISLSLVFVPLIFPPVIFLHNQNPRIAFSVFTLCPLVFSVIFALKDKSSNFLSILGFSALCVIVKCANFGFSLLNLSFFAFFLISLLLLREKILPTKIKSVIFILLRIFIATIFVSFYIFARNYDFSLEISVGKRLCTDLILFLPQLIFSIASIFYLAKKQIVKIFSIFDIFLNLTVLILMEFLVFSPFVTDFLLAFCNFMILLNATFATIRYILFKKADFFPYFALALVQAFVICSFNGTESDFLWTMTAILFLFHLFGRFSDFQKVSKIFSAVSSAVNGILFCIESVGAEIFTQNPLPTNALSAIYITFLFGLCVLLCVGLVRKKEIFNIAMIFHTSLFFSEKSLQILALPALTLFCLYYFVRAYKENSAKKANFTAVYFTAVLMIRFFTLGYGLVSQGLSLISLGIALLLINRFLRKKQ